MKSTALCAFSLLLCTCPAAVPLRWTVETSRAVPAQFEAYQGETLELEAALKSYGTPLEAPAQYSLYWQTNGMGNAWWEAPCAGSAAPTNVLFATWSPTNDVGAKVYNCFVGRPGAIYHAAFQLRLRPSPGATPSVLEPPVKVLDFAVVEVRNAPWIEAAAIQEMRDGMAELNEGYARLYGFATGSTNAHFTVTNYPATRAEAEARFRFEPEDGMDFSDVPASLRLNENRDGEWRTVVDVRDWTAWYIRWREIRLTNEIARLTAENAALSARLEASMAWGGRTANGVENPLDDTVVVDRANTWLMADCEWQKFVSGSNSCWVLRSRNAALSAGGNTNGFLEIRDAFGKAHVRINKTADAFADPVPSSIRWDRDEDAWYVAFSDTVKPTRGGANCELEGSGRKAVLYAEDDPDCPATITWPDVPESGPGNWIMKAVPKTVGGVKPNIMFFGAEIAVPGVEYVEFLSEAAFGGGIRVGNNVYEPRESGGTLTWEKRQ